jgi:hypothetical protein
MISSSNFGGTTGKLFFMERVRKIISREFYQGRLFFSGMIAFRTHNSKVSLSSFKALYAQNNAFSQCIFTKKIWIERCVSSIGKMR